MSLNLIELFIEMMCAERGASKNTLKAYKNDLIDLLKFLDLKNIKMNKATAEDLQEYLLNVAKNYLSAKTQNRRLCAIHEFYRFLLSENIIKNDPSKYLQASKSEKSLPKYLSEKEIEKLINTAAQQNLRLHLLLEMLYASGMRVSELVSLPLSAVTHDTQTVTIIGKGNKERIVPLNTQTIKLLDKWLMQREFTLNKGRQSKWLFPSFSKEGHLTRDGFFKQLKKTALQAGIDPLRVSPHVFRHSFASHLIAHDADLRSVQKMLGHADIATTEIYTHILQDRLKKTVEKSHPLAYSTQKGY
ncbi:MAG: site-specific tyrosine recombinase XerD [Alphaproteobacteria bacterium]|nr:site-specific tyrosine recombinase XerD [Alphaproteobacteria bacterium]